MIRFAVLIFTLLAAPAFAQVSTFDVQAQLQYDPNRVISVGGGTLGQLMAEMTGVAPNAVEAGLSARISYRSDTQAMAVAADNGAAGFPQALVGMGLRIGQIAMQLDVPLVQANAASSKIGMIAGNGSFCTDYESCAELGQRNAPWGMHVVVLDNSESTLIDENGETVQLSDALAFEAGRTAAIGEFTPALATSGFGVVAVDGLSVQLISKPTGLLLSGLQVPPIQTMTGTAEIARTEVWLFLEGAQLNGIVRVEGVVTGMSIVE